MQHLQREHRGLFRNKIGEFDVDGFQLSPFGKCAERRDTPL